MWCGDFVVWYLGCVLCVEYVVYVVVCSGVCLCGVVYVLVSVCCVIDWILVKMICIILLFWYYYG